MLLTSINCQDSELHEEFLKRYLSRRSFSSLPRRPPRRTHLLLSSTYAPPPLLEVHTHHRCCVRSCCLGEEAMASPRYRKGKLATEQREGPDENFITAREAAKHGETSGSIIVDRRCVVNHKKL